MVYGVKRGKFKRKGPVRTPYDNIHGEFAYLWCMAYTMINFEAELVKLLAQESKPVLQSELTELAAVGEHLLSTLNKKQADISLQVEELYDLTKESDNTSLLESIKDEKARAAMTVRTAIGLSDLIDDFYEFAKQSGSEDLARQAVLMRKKADVLLEKCGTTRLGEEGQALDPEIHAVQSGAASRIPREHVAKVLQSGYRYLGAIVRKATVVVSIGRDAYLERRKEEPSQGAGVEYRPFGQNAGPESRVPKPDANMENRVPVSAASWESRVPVSAASWESRVPKPDANMENRVPVPAASWESRAPGFGMSSDSRVLDPGVSSEGAVTTMHSESRAPNPAINSDSKRLDQVVNWEGPGQVMNWENRVSDQSAYHEPIVSSTTAYSETRELNQSVNPETRVQTQISYSENKRPGQGAQGMSSEGKPRNQPNNSQHSFLDIFRKNSK